MRATGATIAASGVGLAGALLAVACGSTDAQVLASPEAAGLSPDAHGGNASTASGGASDGDGGAGAAGANPGGGPTAGAGGATTAQCPFGPGVTTLYTTGANGDYAKTLAADETTVFWGASHLYAAPIAGGSPTDWTPGFDAVGAIAIAGGAPYIVGDRSGTTGLFAVSDGGATLLGAGSSTGPVATDGTRVYFAPFSLHVVASFLLDGSAPVTITTQSPVVNAIAVHGDDVFVATMTADGSESSLIERGSVAGGTTTIVAQANQHVWFVTADDSGVYWAEEPNFAGAVKAVIRRADRDGANAATIATLDVGGVVGLVVDATSVYYDRGDSILAVAKADGTSATIAPALHDARSLAQNGSSLFWVNEAGGTTPTPPPQNAVMASCK